MGAETTTYRVETVYDVTDRASRALGEIDRSAKSAAGSSERLSSVLGSIGAVLIGGAGLGAAKAAFIDFNAQVQDTKSQIAGMLALSSKSSFVENIARADTLFGNLQKRAASLPGTTQEYAAMAGMIAQPIVAAGLGMKDLEDLTVNTVVAAKALRVEAGAAARDVDQALRGQYHSVDVFTGKLLGSVGYAGETGRAKYNALDSAKRAAELKRAIMQPQIEEMSKAQGESFTGLMSTLQDTIQQTLGKVGAPLFKLVSHEIQNWNQWLDKNSVKIDHIVDQVGKGLVSGFEAAKNATMWIVDHADTLIAIGKVWAATKLVGAVGGGIAGSLGGMASSMGGSASNATAGGIMAVGTASYMATTEFMKLTGAMDALEAAIDPQGYKLRKVTESLNQWDDALEQSRRNLAGETGGKGGRGTNTYANMQGAISQLNLQLNALGDVERMGMKFGNMRYAGSVKSTLLDAGFDDDKARKISGGYQDTTSHQARLDEMSRIRKERDTTKERADKVSVLTEVNYKRVMDGLSASERASVDEKKAMQDLAERINRDMAAGGNFFNGDQSNWLAIRDILLGTNHTSDSFGQVKPSVTNIKIDRVEVAAKDPDRWIAELDAKARSHVAAPRQARAAQRR
jgi:hypothetical protein